MQNYTSKTSEASSERGVLVGCAQAAYLPGLRQSRWALHLLLLQAASCNTVVKLLLEKTQLL